MELLALKSQVGKSKKKVNGGWKKSPFCKTKEMQIFQKRTRKRTNKRKKEKKKEKEK